MLTCIHDEGQRRPVVWAMPVRAPLGRTVDEEGLEWLDEGGGDGDGKRQGDGLEERKERTQDPAPFLLWASSRFLESSDHGGIFQRVNRVD